MEERTKRRYHKRHDALWWSKTIEEIEESSEPTEEACARLGVSSTSFYKWRSKLRAKSQSNTIDQRFEAMDINLFGGSNEYEIVFPSGTRLQLRSSEHLATSLPTIISLLEGPR
jgi:hypothetical protein